ncbi:MAG TPA: hypothetical protein VE993_04705 [Stellaceae bacterium]|nr:hypothetical protein [Stellaceae bacterium]
MGEDREAEGGMAAPGCAYVVAVPDGAAAQAVSCGMPCRPGSSYCAAHHRLCHLARGSRGEALRLQRIAALADIAGGRRAPERREPPPAWLNRVERAARPVLRASRSRFVQGGS